MRPCLAAIAIWLLAPCAPSQDAASAAKARAALEAAAAKGDPKALAQALARRPGDWFDVVLGGVAEPMPAIEPTRALIAALPEPEKSGVGAILEALAAAPAADRQNFAAALGALSGVTRAFNDPRADSKAVSDAAAHAAERIQTASHPWLAARGVLANAMGRFDAGLANDEAGLAAAVEKLSGAGDRYGAGLALAFRAKALADKGELAQAAAERDRAEAALAALGVNERAGSGIRVMLAKIDLALAGPLFMEARDEAAALACARARAAFRTADPMRDLVAATIEAAILVDAGSAAQAVEALKPHMNRLPQIKEKPALTEFATTAATALRITGKSPAALDLLRKAVGRAKELGMTPEEESPLRMAMALAYMQSAQNEAAHAALEVVAKFADRPALRPLAKAAVLNRAVLLHSQGRDDEARKSFDRAATIPLGGPTLERVAAAGPFLSIAEHLVDKNRPKDALRFLRDAADVAEELGLRIEDVRIATTTAAAGGAPIHVRLGIALANYQTGPEWAGFEPVFMATERRLLDVLSAAAEQGSAPADMQERLQESDRQVRLLRRSAAGVRPPIAEDEARRIAAFRKAMVDEAWSRAPAYALRRFPRAGSIKRARDHYCGVDGAILGASVTGEAAYAFAFSRDRFVFSSIDISLRVHDGILALAGLAKDPHCAPAAWVSACAPLWEHLILKQIPVFEDKQWLVVCPDPSIDGIPIEALVPGDARSDSWRTLPYLMQRIAVGRIPTSTLASDVRTRRVAGWLPEPFVAIGLGPKDPLSAGLALARAYDREVPEDTLKTGRVLVFQLGSADERTAESAPSRRARILVLGPGASPDTLDWQGPDPALIFALDPPDAGVASRWMIRGVRAVVAPSGPIDRPLAEALAAGFLKSIAQDGGNPVEALAIAKRSLLGASAGSPAGGLSAAHYHPAQWTLMQAWLSKP